MGTSSPNPCEQKWGFAKDLMILEKTSLFVKVFSKYRRFWLVMIAIIVLIGIGGIFGRAKNQYHPEIAVIFNQSDQLSTRVARYYKERRGIPLENLIAVDIKTRGTTISPEEFVKIKAQVDARTPANVQFYAVVWANPYRVGCMSITSAFTFGFDRSYCAKGCVLTKANPYFGSESLFPYRDFKIRPSMVIPVADFIQARALIDRGIAADRSYPKGKAYLMSTSDSARNVRAAIYPLALKYLSDRFELEVIQSDELAHKKDVMFYFTGLSQVNSLETNYFLPGAIADHLTSFGGALTDSFQMSSLKWLEARATGSYGTVEEPCNFLQKFPNPGLAIFRYLQGDRLIEAYWKSVEQPGQGIFIGEPLARPFSND